MPACERAPAPRPLRLRGPYCPSTAAPIAPRRAARDARAARALGAGCGAAATHSACFLYAFLMARSSASGAMPRTSYSRVLLRRRGRGRGGRGRAERRARLELLRAATRRRRRRPLHSAKRPAVDPIVWLLQAPLAAASAAASASPLQAWPAAAWGQQQAHRTCCPVQRAWWANGRLPACRSYSCWQYNALGAHTGCDSSRSAGCARLRKLLQRAAQMPSCATCARERHWALRSGSSPTLQRMRRLSPPTAARPRTNRGFEIER